MESLKDRINRLLAEKKAASSAAPAPEPAASTIQTQDKYGNTISLNSAQAEFVSLASTGKSVVLIGSAGTGKTTSQRAAVDALIQSGRAGILSAEDHKHLKSGTPGIVIVAYTRRAVNNIRRSVSADLASNCLTIHKLLEYEPEVFTIRDPETGEERNSMRFIPTRTADKPLPASVKIIIFEEASMLGTDLYIKLREAIKHPIQEIILGDIQQLPPVFGPAVLGFKMNSKPVIELTEVYRQALESPIIRLAHRILSGKSIPATEFPEWKFPGQLTLHAWKKKLAPLDATNVIRMFFEKAHAAHAWDPDEDIILTPYNKSFGTLEINKHLANYLARHRGVETYQVIAGFNKLYFSPGDRVMHDKEDATIVSILPNPAYSGAAPQKESIHLNYWGELAVSHDPSVPIADPLDDLDIDHILAQAANTDDENRFHQASHIIELRMDQDSKTIRVSKSSEINALLHGYAITVHKAQGSEFRKVFLLTHHTQSAMISRELLYTACTRAREELYVICEPDTFVKGINSQRVKGNSLKEKAEQFKGTKHENAHPYVLE